MNQTLSHCQLGYRPASPKTITLCPEPETAADLPEELPFYLVPLMERLNRGAPPPAAWKGGLFRWPFQIAAGKIDPGGGEVLHRGQLRRVESRWGTVWQGEFDAFARSGNYQIETPFGNGFPLQIRDDLYERIHYGFLHYLYCQRSGTEVPGIRPAAHLDDGVLDRDGRQVDAAGGWYNAGDLRKWMFLTQPSVHALATLFERGHPTFRSRAADELRWGNRFFQSMIADDGQVWEDIGGGAFKAGLDLEKDWWYENHPGCNCDSSGCVYTDNRPGSGDERVIRTHYNPAVQFLFVRSQCRAAAVLEGGEAARCRELARRAWRYGRERGHDGRTLFAAEEAWAALELTACDAGDEPETQVAARFERLLERQDAGGEGLSHYFMEKDGADGFRCIAMACEPVAALLRLIELKPAGLEALVERAERAVAGYAEHYLLADARSNPFSLTPYGVYVNPPLPERQLFREAGRGRGVRSFIHPFSAQQVIHGTGGVVQHQAVVLAKAGALLERPDWQAAAERLIQWTLGHNPESLCLHTGVGYRHPTPFSAYIPQIPDAMLVGHVGWPDDRPYLEDSPLIEWSTQEVWDIPQAYMAEAVAWL